MNSKASLKQLREFGHDDCDENVVSAFRFLSQSMTVSGIGAVNVLAIAHMARDQR